MRRTLPLGPLDTSMSRIAVVEDLDDDQAGLIGR
jgi:hypothetical protein